jgi:hypothetical protein
MASGGLRASRCRGKRGISRAEHTRRRPRRARCSACTLVRPGSVARRAGARGEARLAVRWHPLGSEGEEEEQGRLPVGSHLAVREDEGIGWRA